MTEMGDPRSPSTRSESRELSSDCWALQDEAPLLSIFIPVRDGARYLPQALDSLLSQDTSGFSDFEIIIADDGSTDDTLVITHHYALSDPRIHVLPLLAGGEVAARNAALCHCHPRAKYLMNHDADDISLPGKLRVLVEYLEAHPEIDILGCDAEYFDDQGQTLNKPRIEHEPERIKATFGQVNSMINSASIFRRAVLDQLGGYRESYRAADDYDFFARALLAGYNLANLPITLHRIRLHSGSISQTRAHFVKYRAEQVRMYYLMAQAKNFSWLSRTILRMRCLFKVGLFYIRYRWKTVRL
jgi:glycosyltransferase involved in cell wall biosynthesis